MNMTKIIKHANEWTVVLLVFLLTASTAVFAAQGSPGSPEGEDHGRKKDSDDQGTLQGLVYGDQWVIVRDVSEQGDGQPVYFGWEWPPEAYNSEGDFDPQLAELDTYDINVTVVGEESGCMQPVSFTALPELNEQFNVSDNNAHFYDSYGRERVPTYLIPLDPECKVPDAFESIWGELVMEADAGRFNLSRSPQAVIDAAYEEAIGFIEEALNVGIGPAGRLLLTMESVDENEDPVTVFKTIDSPSENLALYQKIMQVGCLADSANVTFTNTSALSDGLDHLDCASGDAGPDNDDMLRAASFLAGAGDKTGRVTMDLLVYLNTRLNLNEIFWSANKKEITDINYYDFGTFTYSRCDTHSTTKANLLQPDEFDSTIFNSTVGVTIFDKRFTHNWPEGVCPVEGIVPSFDVSQAVDVNSPIINFVRAADDALSIIGYIHNYELPKVPMPPIEEPVYP